MDNQGTSLDQLPGGNMGASMAGPGAPPSMDGHGNPALMANQQLDAMQQMQAQQQMAAMQGQGQDPRMMQAEEPVYDDEDDYGPPPPDHPLQQYQIGQKKGWMSYIMDNLLGQLKEPLIVAVIVFLINLKPVRELLFNYVPVNSSMVFGLVKALIAAIAFFVVKRVVVR